MLLKCNSPRLIQALFVLLKAANASLALTAPIFSSLSLAWRRQKAVGRDGDLRILREADAAKFRSGYLYGRHLVY